MDVAQLARGQAYNRVAIGAGLVLAPGMLARVWVGGHATDDRAKVLAFGPKVPLASCLLGGAMAAGSAALAAASAREPTA